MFTRSRRQVTHFLHRVREMRTATQLETLIEEKQAAGAVTVDQLVFADNPLESVREVVVSVSGIPAYMLFEDGRGIGVEEDPLPLAPGVWLLPSVTNALLVTITRGAANVS